ncbi:hypothetical protein CC78DRAFT_92133 [Lojkania enalia]|uniref:Uncharacterized protein n=1 Tax=Lojkania enalia TaxID=147567 RepID=A0A9P4KDC9_9PLEO|nr:hypothetical protein CC78DRAFT_92133 [Didymosphaeria enalia]
MMIFTGPLMCMYITRYGMWLEVSFAGHFNDAVLCCGAVRCNGMFRAVRSADVRHRRRRPRGPASRLIGYKMRTASGLLLAWACLQRLRTAIPRLRCWRTDGEAVVKLKAPQKGGRIASACRCRRRSCRHSRGKYEDWKQTHHGRCLLRAPRTAPGETQSERGVLCLSVVKNRGRHENAEPW